MTTQHYGATLETTRIPHTTICDIRMDCDGRYHMDAVEHPDTNLYDMSGAGYRTQADAKRAALDSGYTHYLDRNNRVRKISVKMF